MSGLDWDWAYAWSVMPDLLWGLLLTVEITLLASALALALGEAHTALFDTEPSVVAELLEAHAPDARIVSGDGRVPVIFVGSSLKSLPAAAALLEALTATA